MKREFVPLTYWRDSGLSSAVNATRTRLASLCFGDQWGRFIFLSSLAVMMLAWQLQFTISDTAALANGVMALGDGQLQVTEPVYGDTLAIPGINEYNGRAYAGNPGQLVIALPVLLLLRAITTVMDLHVAVAATWSLLLLAAAVTGGRLLQRETAGRVLGSGVALSAFFASLWLADPTQIAHYALPALQITTLILAGFVAVLIYRLCRRAFDRRVGVAAGLATGLATPTLLWASIPKRHVPVAALALCSLYLLYRSRTADSDTRARRFRWIAYAPVGLSAWVFVGAGATLFIALALADVATARDNDITSLAGVVGVVLISLLPFFVTNFIMTGNPLTSHIMLPDYTQPAATGGTAEGGGGGSSPNVRGASDESALPVMVQQLLYILEEYLQSFVAVYTDPGRLNSIFVRSGWYEELSKGYGAINLSVTESMPLVGALVGLPVIIVRRLRTREFGPIHAADLFVITYAVLTLLLYLKRLPVHAQLTVRYLFVLYPLAVYGLVRLPWVRAVFRTQYRILGWTYTGGVLIGGQLLLAGSVVINATFAEAMQAVALWALAIAGLLAVWSLASAGGRDCPRLGAILLGLAASMATNLYLIVFPYYLGGHYAVPLVPW